MNPVSLRDDEQSVWLHQKDSSEYSALDSGNKIAYWQADADNHPDHDETGIIARLLKACLDTLSYLLKHLETLSVAKREQATLRRCHATLKLWDRGHKVLEGRLDDILAQTKHLQNTTLSILNPLCRVLSNGLDNYIVNNPTDAAVSQLRASNAEIYDKTKWLLSTDDDYSGESDSDISSYGDNSQRSRFTQVVEDVKMHTGCLVDLNAALECPAVDQDFNDEPTALKIEQRAAHDYHADLVLAKFPHANADLIQCLGKISWDRYQRMQQEREQNSKLTAAGFSGMNLPSQSQFALSEFQDSGLGTSIPAVPTQYAETVISFMTSVTGGKRVSIPPLTAEAKSGAPFECNACGKQIRINNNREWRKHLYLDLRPYTCLYTGCTFTSTPFMTRQLWSDHLTLDHDIRPNCDIVECPLCLENTGPGRSSILIHFARHMEEIALAALPREVESEEDSDAGSRSSLSGSVGNSSALTKDSSMGIFTSRREKRQRRILTETTDELERLFSDQNISSMELRRCMDSHGFVEFAKLIELNWIHREANPKLIKIGDPSLLELRLTDGRPRVRRKHGWETWVLGPTDRAPTSDRQQDVPADYMFEQGQEGDAGKEVESLDELQHALMAKYIHLPEPLRLEAWSHATRDNLTDRTDQIDEVRSIETIRQRFLEILPSINARNNDLCLDSAQMAQHSQAVSNPRLFRCKVSRYRSKWHHSHELGIGFCHPTIQDRECIIVTSDDLPRQELVRITLDSERSLQRLFRKQPLNIITWREQDGFDVVLEFQEPDGCEHLWTAINNVLHRRENLALQPTIVQSFNNDRFEAKSAKQKNQDDRSADQAKPGSLDSTDKDSTAANRQEQELAVEKRAKSLETQQDPLIDDDSHLSSQPHLKESVLATQVPSRPANTTEGRVLSDFELHARKCAYCHDPEEVFLRQEKLCDLGQHLAKDVTRLLYNKSDGETYSTVEEDYRVIRVEIPASYLESQSLLKAMARWWSENSLARKPIDSNNDTTPISIEADTITPGNGKELQNMESMAFDAVATSPSSDIVFDHSTGLESKPKSTRGSLYNEDMGAKQHSPKENAVEVRESSPRNIGEDQLFGNYRGKNLLSPPELLAAPDERSAVSSDEPRYCYCNQVSYGEMVGCDNHDCSREWFHLACVNLEKAPTGRTKWFCSDECKETYAKLHSKPLSSLRTTKSRRGCYNCKRRRIKCNEQYPECRHCIRAGLSCEYPITNMTPQYSASKEIPTPATEAAPSPPPLDPEQKGMRGSGGFTFIHAEHPDDFRSKRSMNIVRKNATEKYLSTDSNESPSRTTESKNKHKSWAGPAPIYDDAGSIYSQYRAESLGPEFQASGTITNGPNGNSTRVLQPSPSVRGFDSIDNYQSGQDTNSPPRPTGFGLTSVEELSEEHYEIKCICSFTSDDGNTVLCENCDTWQHIMCYYESTKAVLYEHQCIDCDPRPIDITNAVAKQRLRQQEMERTTSSYICRICKQQFRKADHLREHEKTHMGPWKCAEEKCEYYFEFGWPTEKERDRHVSDKHTSSPPQYKCAFPPCTYSSKRESNCKQHMEKAHGNKNRTAYSAPARLSEPKLQQSALAGSSRAYDSSMLSNIDNHFDISAPSLEANPWLPTDFQSFDTDQLAEFEADLEHLRPSDDAL